MKKLKIMNKNHTIYEKFAIASFTFGKVEGKCKLSASC